MTFRLEINCNSAAFEGRTNADRQREIGRILDKVSRRLEDYDFRPNGAGLVLHDINGNRVGTATLTEEETK